VVNGITVTSSTWYTYEYSTTYYTLSEEMESKLTLEYEEWEEEEYEEEQVRRCAKGRPRRGRPACTGAALGTLERPAGRRLPLVPEALRVPAWLW
jgi:hypothetical protein